jgi:hypothetical protein
MAQSHTEIAMKQIMADRQTRAVGEKEPDIDILSNIRATVNAKITDKGGETIRKGQFTVGRIAKRLRTSESDVRRWLKRLRQENKIKADIAKEAFVQRRSKKPEDTSPWSGIAKNRGDELAARTVKSLRALRKQQREQEEEEIT